MKAFKLVWTNAKKANNPLKSGSTFSSEPIGRTTVPLEKIWTDNGDHGALILLCWKRVEADAGEDFWGGRQYQQQAAPSVSNLRLAPTANN